MARTNLQEYDDASRIVKDMIEQCRTDSALFPIIVEKALLYADLAIGELKPKPPLETKPGKAAK